MTNDVSRRNFVALAGTGLALSACKGAPPTSAAEGDDSLKMFSPCNDWGDSPRKEDKAPLPKNVDWQPTHYCVVYINLDNSQLIAKHAYYPTKFDKPLSNTTEPSSASVGAFAALQAMSKTGQWPAGYVEGSDINFGNFWFGSQHEIYILVDGTLARLDTEKLLVFAEQKTKKNSVLPKPSQNKTFYNAISLKDSSIKNDVLFVQNWFVDSKNQKPIPKKPNTNHKYIPEEVYSMNIHILIGAADIPAVIDPDTGNGMGNNP